MAFEDDLGLAKVDRGEPKGFVDDLNLSGEKSTDTAWERAKRVVAEDIPRLLTFKRPSGPPVASVPPEEAMLAGAEGSAPAPEPVTPVQTPLPVASVPPEQPQAAPGPLSRARDAISQIELDRRKLEGGMTELDAMGKGIKASKSEYDKGIKELTSIKKNLESVKVDRSSQESVDAFNAMVAEYNTKLQGVQSHPYVGLAEQYNAKAGPLKVLSDKLREQVGAYNRDVVVPSMLVPSHVTIEQRQNAAIAASSPDEMLASHVVARPPGAVISATPSPDVMGLDFDMPPVAAMSQGAGRELSPNQRDKATDVMTLSRMTNLPPNFIQAHFDDLTKQMGIRGTPTLKELADEMMKYAIGAGLATAPLKTAIGVGTFMATKEAESLGVQAAKGEKLKLGQGREVKEFAGPLEGWTDVAADVAEFVIPGAIAGGTLKIPKMVADSTWYRKMKIPERGLVVQTVEDLRKAGASEAELARKDPEYWKEAFRKRGGHVDGEAVSGPEAVPEPEKAGPIPAPTPPKAAPKEVVNVPVEARVEPEGRVGEHSGDDRLGSPKEAGDRGKPIELPTAPAPVAEEGKEVAVVRAPPPKDLPGDLRKGDTTSKDVEIGEVIDGEDRKFYAYVDGAEVAGPFDSREEADHYKRNLDETDVIPIAKGKKPAKAGELRPTPPGVSKAPALEAAAKAAEGHVDKPKEEAPWFSRPDVPMKMVLGKVRPYNADLNISYDGNDYGPQYAAFTDVETGSSGMVPIETMLDPVKMKTHIEKGRKDFYEKQKALKKSPVEPPPSVPPEVAPGTPAKAGAAPSSNATFTKAQGFAIGDSVYFRTGFNKEPQKITHIDSEGNIRVEGSNATRSPTEFTKRIFKGLPVDKPGRELTDADMDILTAPEGRAMSERNRDLGKHESDPRFLVYLKPGEIGYQPNLSPHLQPVRTDYRLIRDFLKDGTLPERGKELQKIADRYRAIDDKISEAAAIKSAAMVRTAIERGAYNSMLHPSNKISRNIFYEITGQKLPAGVGATQKFFTLKPFEKKAAWLKEKAKETVPVEEKPVVVEEILSPDLEYERFIDSLTPEQKVTAKQWIARRPSNPLGQIQAIKKAIHNAAILESDEFKKAGEAAGKMPEGMKAEIPGTAEIPVALLKMFRSTLDRNGAARIGNVDYKIQERADGGYFYSRVEDGIRITKGPVGPPGVGGWSRGKAIQEAVEEAGFDVRGKAGAAPATSPLRALEQDLERKGAGRLGNIDYKIQENDHGRYSYTVVKDGVRRTVEPMTGQGLGWGTREDAIGNIMAAAQVRAEITPLTTGEKAPAIEVGGTPDAGGTGEGVREKQLLDGPPSVAPGEQAAVREKDVLQGPVKAPDVPVPEGGAGDESVVQPSGKGPAPKRDRRDSGESSAVAAPAGDRAGAVAGAPEVRNHPVGREPVRIEDRNHVIAPGDTIVPAGKVSRINANIKALELSRKLEAENRNPSPEEKKILAQFSGWGSLSEDVFKFDKYVQYDRQKDGTIADWSGGDPEKYRKWFDRVGKKLHPDLGGILSKEEWATARASTTNAHYTSREVITKGLWPIAERLGAKGGRIVEPSAGIGHILGLMPESIAKRAIVQAVELDKTSGVMLKRLYPEANVQITGFQNARAMKDNSADLIITNVPFGDYPVTDPKHKNYSGWNIHNYFIAREIDLARPGGIVISITSHYTLDSAGGAKMRDYFSKKADFVGAVRLPATAFDKSAGTSVVTDILVFRKKDASQFDGAQQFRDVLTVKTAAGEDAPVNEYFVNHPEMVLGEHSMKGTMYGGGGKEYTLLPGKEPLEEALVNAVGQFPAAVAGEGALVSRQAAETMFADEGVKNGTLLEKDGKLYVNDGGELVRPDFAKHATKVIAAKRYIVVRDHAKELIRLQLDEATEDVEIVKQREKLNKAYDDFVKRHGWISDRSNQWLSEDGEYPLALSLEKQVDIPKTYEVKSGPNKGQVTKSKEKTFVKTAIFTERTIFPFKEPISADSAEDAVKISMTYRNKVDAAYIAKLLNGTVKSVTEKLTNDGLAYINPATGLLEGQDDYLSGNVRDKLIRAQEAAKDDPLFEKNVEALKKVQPKDLEIDQIYMRIGSTWVPPEAYTDFIRDTLGMEIKVSYSESADNSKFFMDNPRHGLSALAQNTWGVEGANALEILKDSFNLKFPEVKENIGTFREPKWVVLEKETIAAREMQRKLQAEFLSWTRKSEKWAPALKNIYNRDKNNMVLKTAHTPTMKHYPGASHSITLYPHQKRAVSRSLQESTLLAHAVGTGKTYIFATTAMEMRRIGTAKKPMIVVQGSTLNQYGRAFRELYPTARVLIPNTRQIQAKNRKKLLAQIATGDWDAVVLQHSTYDMLSVKPEKEAAYVQEQIAELEAIIKEMEARGEDKRTVKQWEKLKKRKEEKIVSLLARGHKEGMLYFDELGVDALLVDEAHKYKRSEFYTKMDRVKGIDSGSAGRSMLHLLKTAEVRGKTGGKNVIIATGTPISNTMAELWTHLRYIRPDLLDAYGVTSFDAFAANFGNVKTELEETMTTDFKEVARFAEYVNGPELLTMWRTAADVIMAEDVNVARPTIKGGAPRQIMLERPAELASFIQGIKLQKQAWDNLPGKEKRDSRHVPLVLFGLAKKAAIDLRLVDASRPDIPGSKVNKVVEESLQVWKDSKEFKAAQVIFSDLYQSPDGKFNLFEDIKKKLIKNGVPANEIAIIHDFKTDEARESLFAKVNDGDVRFIMGGTEKLGVGVNIQERLVRAHHLDIPGRPMDFEQRNGRIWRPGNTIDTIDITTYGHKATMDSVAAQRLQTKQKFINQVLRGDLQDRTFEDPFDPAQGTFEDMMASFGNPKVREKFGLESQIRNLKALKLSHENEVGRARTTIWQNNNSIERLAKNKEEWESAIKELDKAFPDGKVTGFDLPEGGGVHDRDSFVEYFTKIAGDLHARAKSKFEGVDRDKYYELRSNGYHLSPIYFGTVNGLKFGFQIRINTEFSISFDTKRKDLKAEVGEPEFKYQLFDKKKSDDLGANRTVSTPRGVMSSIETFIRNAKDRPAELRKEAAHLAKQNKDLAELLDKPFEHEDDLADKERRLVEVEVELKAAPVEDLTKTPADEGEFQEEPPEFTDLLKKALAGEDALSPASPETDWWEGKVLGKEDIADTPTTKKYFVAKGVQSDTPGFKEVKGYAVDIEEGTDTFVHHIIGKKSWTVSEGKSGLGFGGIHDTKEAAIEGAKNAIDTLPGKSLKKWIDENLSSAVEKQGQGYSPRYGKKPEAAASETPEKKGILGSEEAEKSLAEVVNKVIPESEPPVGLSIRPVDVVIGKPEYSEKDYAFGTEETESRYKAAHGLKPEPILRRAREVVRMLVNKATREYEHLPRTAEFAPLRTALLRLARQKGVAADRTVRAMQGITVKFDKVRMGLFERKVLLDDLAEEAKSDHPLPFGFTKESVAAELAKIDKLLKHDPVVEQGLYLRQKFTESVKQSYIAAMDAIGFKVADRFTKENYFRHQVIEYANLKGVVGSGKRLRTPTGRGFLKKRKGSEYDINTNYLEAEYEVIAQMLYDIEVAKTIKVVGDVYNVAPMAKGEGIPDGYVEWQPREGNTFYVAESIPAKLAEKLREGAIDMAEIDVEGLRQVLALGGKRKRFIVKQEVADTLNSLLKAKPQGALLGYDKKILTGWKVWQLVSPRRFFKYNFRNLTGDADAAFVGNPSTFKRAPQAARELYQVFTADRGMTPEMREWFKRGGFETTLQAQELSELNKMRIFSHVREAGEPLRNLPVAAFKKYWKTVRLATDFREAVLRYAAFLDYLEQIKADPKGQPKNFGGSIPEEIMAIKDPYDKAFTLSNQLLGAYDQVSVMGNAMRDHLIPFWSWKEVNFRRYIQFIKNAVSDKKMAEAVGRKALGSFAKAPYTAWRVGKFLISVTAFWAMLQAWNNLMFPEEESELDEQNRNRPHIIFGRDSEGKIINFTRVGALGDFLQWFGLDAFPLQVSRWASGKRTLREIVMEMAKSPVNVVAQGITPVAKTSAELASRRVLFPDIFKPRAMRDRGYYLAQSVGLENEYKKIAGLPSEGYEKSLAQFFIYRSDPGQNAYSDILQAKSRYLEKIGKSSEGAFISPKSNALYNLRLAIRYKDANAKEKFMEEYLSLNGTPEGVRDSLKRMHPLGGLSKRDARDFKETLDAEDKEKLAKAIHFHENVLAEGERDIYREARIMRNRILRERR